MQIVVLLVFDVVICLDCVLIVTFVLIVRCFAFAGFCSGRLCLLVAYVCCVLLISSLCLGVCWFVCVLVSVLVCCFVLCCIECELLLFVVDYGVVIMLTCVPGLVGCL